MSSIPRKVIPHPKLRVLPNGRTRKVSRYCQRGHDKEQLGYTSKGGCRECMRARTREKRKWLDEYKLNRGCAECGYNRCASALHFHHLDPSKKQVNVAMKYAWNKERLLKELAKCRILCSNCHLELHEKERKRRGCYARNV